MDEEVKIDYTDISIGQYADYFHYDPDGIAGPPTPRDPALEDRLFGKGLMDVIRKRNEPA